MDIQKKCTYWQDSAVPMSVENGYSIGTVWIFFKRNDKIEFYERDVFSSPDGLGDKELLKKRAVDEMWRDLPHDIKDIIPLGEIPVNYREYITHFYT